MTRALSREVSRTAPGCCVGDGTRNPCSLRLLVVAATVLALASAARAQAPLPSVQARAA
jgi:hypothetical protein